MSIIRLLTLQFRSLFRKKSDFEIMFPQSVINRIDALVEKGVYKSREEFLTQSILYAIEREKRE